MIPASGGNIHRRAIFWKASTARAPTPRLPALQRTRWTRSSICARIPATSTFVGRIHAKTQIPGLIARCIRARCLAVRLLFGGRGGRRAKKRPGVLSAPALSRHQRATKEVVRRLFQRRAAARAEPPGHRPCRCVRPYDRAGHADDLRPDARPFRRNAGHRGNASGAKTPRT